MGLLYIQETLAKIMSMTSEVISSGLTHQRQALEQNILLLYDSVFENGRNNSAYEIFMVEN